MISPAWPPRFLALGNGVWLDEIRNEGKDPIVDVPGGSVTFATLGARLFVPNDPSSIAMIFHAGYDFPENVVDVLKNWSINLDIHHLSDKPSSRGLVFYDKANSNRKGFQRLTDPLPVTICGLDLYSSPFINARAFHFFGTPQYVQEQMEKLRETHPHWTEVSSVEKPLIVWEPHAKSCRPDTLQDHIDAAKLVDVFSPNHEELQSLFVSSADAARPFDQAEVKRYASHIAREAFQNLGSSTGARRRSVIVRCAGHGCYINTDSVRAASDGQERGVWLPSYWPPDSSQVVDPTGAGNAFLGALAIGMQECGGDVVQAAMYGMVAAGLVIEQVGLPCFEYVYRDGAREERWNGDLVEDRLRSYQNRCAAGQRDVKVTV